MTVEKPDPTDGEATTTVSSRGRSRASRDGDADLTVVDRDEPARDEFGGDEPGRVEDGPAADASPPAEEPVEDGSAEVGSSVWTEAEEGRSRRSVLRALSALGIAVVAAVALGLLIAIFSKAVGDDPSVSRTPPPALTVPSGSAPASSVIPNDWVEQTSADSIVFKAPPGWTERRDSQVDFRVEPSSSGPGLVGVGLVTGSTDPDAAAMTFLTGTYSGQPSYVAQPGTDVTSARGERGRQVVATYSRSGTPVAVVVRAFPTPRGVVLVVSRATLADGQRAGRLADALDASIRLP